MVATVIIIMMVAVISWLMPGAPLKLGLRSPGWGGLAAGPAALSIASKRALGRRQVAVEAQLQSLRVSWSAPRPAWEYAALLRGTQGEAYFASRA